MWYIDLEEGGNKYRGVYFTKYRPMYATYESYDNGSNSYQDNHGYEKNNVYWFKYEPIQWTVLAETGSIATLLCDLAIDVQQWDYDGSFTNNYKESTIRKWLNETFYNTAFDDLQKAIIRITEVDNSASTTEISTNTHACDDTSDNVYLLSYEDAKGYYSYDTLRQKGCTDYAKSQGSHLSADSSYSGNAYWWLRSPGNGDGIACSVNYYGGISTISTIYGTDYSVVPAITILL